MRSGGFPCRIAGCDRAFRVVDQSSLESLRAASSERTAHEIDDHGYHHVTIQEERAYTPQLRVKRPSGPVR